jgi:hypothetical protein
LNSDINQQVLRIDLAARQEKLPGSEWAQTGNALRYLNIKIFEVESNATGSGIYNCYEQELLKNAWDNITGLIKIWQKDTPPVSVEVLNLEEYHPDSSQHDLALLDIMFAWQVRDDKGIKRWIGLPAKSTGGTDIHLAYCKTDAPAATEITCFLDADNMGEPEVWVVGTYYRGEPEVWVVGTYYSEEVQVIGTDGKYYTCVAAHTAATENCPITGVPGWIDYWEVVEEVQVIGTDGKYYTCIKSHTAATENCPITGVPGWIEYWEVVEEITVKCDIFGGGNLDTASPYLEDGKEIKVCKIGGDWCAVWWFQGHINCENPA